MRIRIVVGAMTFLSLIIAALVYLGINRPWWQERGELERIFSNSDIRISSKSNRGGTLFCLDSCPSLTVSLDSNHYTYGTFTSSLSRALGDHQYLISNDNLRVQDDSGQLVTSPFDCVAPNGFSGDVDHWQCKFAATAPRYHIYGYFSLPADTAPQQRYHRGDLVVSGSMPAQAQLINASLTLEENH